MSFVLPCTDGQPPQRPGTCGEVLASGAVGRAAAEVVFRLTGPPGGPPGGKLAAAAVRAALLAKPPRARKAASGGSPAAGAFVACFSHEADSQVRSMRQPLDCTLQGMWGKSWGADVCRVLRPCRRCPGGCDMLQLRGSKRVLSSCRRSL